MDSNHLDLPVGEFDTKLGVYKFTKKRRQSSLLGISLQVCEVTFELESIWNPQRLQ